MKSRQFAFMISICFKESISFHDFNLLQGSSTRVCKLINTFNFRFEELRERRRARSVVLAARERAARRLRHRLLEGVRGGAAAEPEQGVRLPLRPLQAPREQDQEQIPQHRCM